MNNYYDFFSLLHYIKKNIFSTKQQNQIITYSASLQVWYNFVQSAPFRPWREAS